MKYSNKTKHLTKLGILTGFALVTFIIENQIPMPIALPGIKPGLANIFTLLCILLLGKGEGLTLLLARILLGGLLTGNLSTILYSLAGGLLAYLTDLLLLPNLKKEQLWAVSALGGLMHNMGQLLLAWVVLGKAVLAYLPWLGIGGICAGLFTGFAARAVLPILERLMQKDRQ